MPDRASPAISVRGLTKFYGSTCGVEDVSFDVFPGEVMGFLGPNGSGKTTVIRMLLGLITMTRGEAHILGTQVGASNPHVRSDVGYLPGTLGLYRNQKVHDYFDFLNSMRRGSSLAYALELARRLALDTDARIAGLSKGNRQKVGVIQAFMHKPKVLILDEPTVGLDPIVQREVEEMLGEVTDAGTTVLLSSHVMREVERVADRVAILDHGHLLVVDDVAGLTSRISRRLVFEFAAPVDMSKLAACTGVLDINVDDTTVECSVVGPETDVLAAAVKLGVLSVTSHEPTLDDVFFSATGNRHVS